MIIQIDTRTAKEIKKRKVTERESYNEILKRLLKISDKK
jgi:hypothetical protein